MNHRIMRPTGQPHLLTSGMADHNNDRKQLNSGGGATAALVGDLDHQRQSSPNSGRINNSPIAPSPLFPNDHQLFTDEKRTVSGEERTTSNAMDQEKVRLPATFAVKFLGRREARGLWGIKHTRKPVDDMVTLAKNLRPGSSLAHLHFKVDVDGVTVSEMPDNRSRDFEAGFYPVDIISYGVQDLIYTRVFSMIVVRDTNISPLALASGGATPFECYGYVCDSRASARQLTIALATAFQEFSRTVKNQKLKHKRIAIDLRTPEEMAAELEDQETEA